MGVLTDLFEKKHVGGDTVGDGVKAKKNSQLQGQSENRKPLTTANGELQRTAEKSSLVRVEIQSLEGRKGRM